MRIQHGDQAVTVSGPCGDLTIRVEDEVSWKLLMLIEGECEERSTGKVAKRYGYCRQRYYQLLEGFRKDGAGALASQKRGPKTKSRRTPETVRQIIRHRFLDPEASVGVIAQKLRQVGRQISIRSVCRVFEEYGLQKKGSTSAGRSRKARNPRS